MRGINQKGLKYTGSETSNFRYSSLVTETNMQTQHHT